MFYHLVKIDFTKLNINARRMCYMHFKTLYVKSKKREELDKSISKTILEALGNIREVKIFNIPSFFCVNITF